MVWNWLESPELVEWPPPLSYKLSLSQRQKWNASLTPPLRGFQKQQPTSIKVFKLYHPPPTMIPVSIINEISLKWLNLYTGILLTENSDSELMMPTKFLSSLVPQRNQWYQLKNQKIWKEFQLVVSETLNLILETFKRTDFRNISYGDPQVATW